MPMSQQLVVIAFDDPMKAQELLLAASRLQSHGELSVEDAVIITKDPDGATHRIETTDLTPAEGALSGAFWGLLFGTLLLGPIGGLVTSAASAGGGALLGKLVDRGVSDEFIKQMKSEIDRGTTAVVFLVNFAHRDAVARELARFDGTLVYSTLSDDAKAAIEEALAEGRALEHALEVRYPDPDTDPDARSTAPDEG